MQLTPEQLAYEFERRKTKFTEYLYSPFYQEKLKQRLEINAACEKSSQARAMTYQLCARPDNPVEGCKFFLETFGWTFDPRPEHAPHHLPLILFPYQERAVEWIIDHIDNGRDGLVEKSRDMGATWLLFVLIPLWYWLFRDGVNILVGSYKEALVDDKTSDSIFGKIDYAIDALPRWMMPKTWNPDKHRTKLKLLNPSNKNQITGDTMNAAFGRGARKTAVLFDELGFWDYAQEAWSSCGDTASCRIANSTPQGYNYYAMLKQSGMDVITLHWKDHPHKDIEWYNFECARRTPEEVAQELDISYTKSREGKVYEEWNEDYVRKGLFPYDEDLPLFISWDFGKSDDTAIIWAQPDYKTGRLRIIDTYKNSGKNIDFYIPFCTGIIPSEGYGYTQEEEKIIEEHRNWRRGTHFGDPAGRFGNQVSDETVISVLRNHGIIVNFKEHWKYFSQRKKLAKRLIMDGIDLNENPRTSYFDMQMINSAYPKVKVDGMDVYRKEKPKHDSSSHYRTAFEYLAFGLEEYRTPRATPFDKFKRIDGTTRTVRRRAVGY